MIIIIIVIIIILRVVSTVIGGIVLIIVIVIYGYLTPRPPIYSSNSLKSSHSRTRARIA